MNSIIIDVRETNEFLSGHVEGARNIPVTHLSEDVPNELKDTPKDTRVIVYCRSGGRSALAKNIIESYGFKNVVNGINKHHVEATYC